MLRFVDLYVHVYDDEEESEMALREVTYIPFNLFRVIIIIVGEFCCYCICTACPE